MSRFFRGQWVLSIVIALAGLAGIAGPAGAEVILSGDSNASSFSSCTGCGSGSTATSLNLGGFTLAIQPISFSASGDTTGLALAALTLTTANNPTGHETFSYNLSLDFTTPVDTLLGNFALGVSASGRGNGSTETLSGFTLGFASPIVLPGVTLSNFRFVDVDNGATGSFANGIWSVTGHGGSASLVLEVDAAATGQVAVNPDPPSAAVPEPASATLLGAALIGIGILRRRNRTQA